MHTTGTAGDGPPVTLRSPRHRVDPRARRWWAVQALLTVSGPLLLTAATLLVLSVLFFPGALPWLVPLLAVVLVAPALGYQFAMPAWRYRIHAWEVGETAVYTANGWFWQRSRIAPLSRVQTVDTSVGPLQRRYGLATVVVTTASTAGAVKIAGLAEDDARRMAEHVGHAVRYVREDAA
ncbi:MULTISPECIES: PH domain-containing protein [Streptomyces]|uniref:PH domain-containing protein n=1 Tax=Streptomyces TaxID=1883 RepID=UPI00163D2295|nr:MULTISPECIES: PH domain-containing protein [Streptomyces]MBC2878415.1 PH domain-containing protein [Streptomyces sp. TYQ1024]UKW31334.1 PH domain-containing protein [Streptomyces sp. TYQ1024]